MRRIFAGALGVLIVLPPLALGGATLGAWSDREIISEPISSRVWAIDVEIDVKPGSDPSSVNPNSGGTIPVAILSTSEFDAATVDPFSVCFGSEHDVNARSCTLDPNGGQPKLKDVTDNGLEDLVLHFRARDTGIEPGDENACLTGMLVEEHGDIEIAGCSDINTVGGGNPKNSQSSTTSSAGEPAEEEPEETTDASGGPTSSSTETEGDAGTAASDSDTPGADEHEDDDLEEDDVEEEDADGVADNEEGDRDG